MPMLSHLHQLFNAEQCQTYLHTLRGRSSAPMSSVPEPHHWPVGHIPIPSWMQTLLVS